jgi:ElaB/YqjD/DUF883 family membrane-anchored ribosome-binding protein
MSQTPISAADGTANAGSGRTTDGLATMAHETIDRAAASANRATDEVFAAATRTVETAKQAQERAIAAGDESLRRVRSYVERNPLTTIGIAVALGALLTTLIRR